MTQIDQKNPRNALSLERKTTHQSVANCYPKIASIRFRHRCIRLVTNYSRHTNATHTKYPHLQPHKLSNDDIYCGQHWVPRAFSSLYWQGPDTQRAIQMLLMRGLYFWTFWRAPESLQNNWPATLLQMR